MPQEDRIYSTGREAIESLREDYRDFNDDPAVSFEEFAGDVLDTFEAAPDAVFSYDPQIRPGSIQRLPEPSREELLGLCDLASTQLMNRARNCANPHDMVRYALAASWIEGDDAKSLTFLTVKQLQCITIELAKNNRADAADVMGDSALENVVDAYGMLLEDTPYEHVIDAQGPAVEPSSGRPEVFCTIQWARDDIAAAIEDAIDPSYDVELDRHGSQGEQVEALIDQVIGEIGSRLQDYSIESGWEMIASAIPNEVVRRAAALGAPEEERSFPAEPVPVYVRDWYVHTYPDDDLGQRINPDMTFDAAMQAVSLGGGFYDALGVDDSIVRERVFRQLDVRTGIPYDAIYEAWLDAKPVPGWTHPVKPPELAPHVPEEALHKPFPPRLADEAASSRTASDMLAGTNGTDHRSPQQEK